MVSLDPDKVGRIKQFLRWNPRGMTITDLSFRMKMNRNLLAKYMDMLLVSGQVDMQPAGKAKVYFLSSRIPIAGMLEYSLDPILVLDAAQRVIQVNESFLRLLGAERDSVLGRRPGEITGGFLSDPKMAGLMDQPDTRQEMTAEMQIVQNGGVLYFRIKRVPTVFEDSSRGMTFILEDITEKKASEERIREHIARLEFLARTSAELADIGDEEDIYQYIVDRIAEMEPAANITINSINPETLESVTRAYGGDKDFVQDMLDYFGNPLGMRFQVQNVPEAIEELSKGEIIEGPESLYIQLYRALPEETCTMIQEKISLGKNYAMGCACRSGLYGNVTIRYRKNDDMQNRETITAFIRQAGIALQRRYLREKIRKSRKEDPGAGERISSPSPGKPVALSGNTGRARQHM